MKSIAFFLLIAAQPAAALAQQVETVGDPFIARTDGVVSVTANILRDALPVASVPSGYTLTWSAFTNDGKPVFLWCDRASLEDCSGRFTWPGIIQAKSGFPVRHGLPNPSASLAGKTVTLITSIAKQTTTGEQVLARERRDIIFVASGATPTIPVPTPTPVEPTWGITTTIRQ